MNRAWNQLQLPTARAVDDILTRWLLQRLTNVKEIIGRDLDVKKPAR